MRVLVLGSGAREHALCWKFSKSKRISGLFIAPGNAGTDELGENIPNLDPNDASAIAQFCTLKDINIVFIGPEEPLMNGVADVLSAKGIPVIGPGRDAARLEGSKVFSKQFMVSHTIPTAEAKEFSDRSQFEQYIRSVSGKKVVIKKSGLAAGKGVLESDDTDTLLDFGIGILEDDTLLVEDFLEGYEISIFALTDGKSSCVLPVCADFKKAGDKDTGPNTGGMGAICPVPIVNAEMLERIRREIVDPTFQGLREDKLTYTGVLYFGLMITSDGPKVLEYNVRFGDPEAQVLLPLIKTDFGDLCDAMVNGKLEELGITITDDSALGVVVASPGYPAEYPKGLLVKPIPAFPEKDVVVFHASTRLDESGGILTGGGRCFTVVGIGPNLLNANVRAYKAVPSVQFEGAWSRSDIGQKFFLE